MTSQRSIPESEFPEVRQAAVDLLELLKKNLPDKCGEASSWNFEKEHSILHNVSEIVPLWGNSDNTSCQGAEHAHIELIKSVAHLTNNKDVFLCILRFTLVWASSGTTSICCLRWRGFLLNLPTSTLLTCRSCAISLPHAAGDAAMLMQFSVRYISLDVS